MKKILVGASVRRDPKILAAHLTTLRGQILPPDTQLDLVHVDDFTTEQREEGLKLLDNVLSGVEQVSIIDFDDTHPQTHMWKQSAFERVAQNKQRLFEHALKENYDFVWICDTDLILDPKTLWSMYHADKPIVAAVYWTRWQKDGGHSSGPQVWLRHPYQLDGRGLDVSMFRSTLAERNLTRVWGLGACMLVRTDVLRKSVRYYPLLPELVAAGGMNAGEDRTFCTLAERSHIEMYADAWPDIYHVYHTEDAENIEAYLNEFKLNQQRAALFPNYGDLVSLQLVPLEDPSVGPQSIRGRVAKLNLLPELEAAVLTMQPGDRRLLRLHFPIHYPLDTIGTPENAVTYRGKSKLVELKLIDHKPMSYAPVLRDEFVQIGESSIDRFFYTSTQLSQLANASSS